MAVKIRAGQIWEHRQRGTAVKVVSVNDEGDAVVRAEAGFAWSIYVKNLRSRYRLISAEEVEDLGLAAHKAAMEHLALCWDLLEQENNDVEIDWAAYPVLAPFDGCTDCIVREVLHIGFKVMNNDA